MKPSILENNSLPFEGVAHEGTIIELPYRKDTWREQAIPARRVFLELVYTISRYERVFLCVDPSIPESEIEAFKMENVEILPFSYNDSWARDNTLIFVVKDGKRVAVDFGFNAWGGAVDGLYPDYIEDQKLGSKLGKYFKDDVISRHDFILEGGSIHSDGKGTLLTTEACLLSKGRNSNLTKEEIENTLKKELMVSKVLWLKNGICNDETNEHVDNMACFLDEGVVALAWCEDESDIQYKYSTEAYEYLSHQTDANGNPIRIVKLPVPRVLKMTKEEASGLEQSDAIVRPEGGRLAGSYINFYMSDKFVIVPQFGVPEDFQALKILKDFYKDKDVYGINSREILLAGGNIHCVTMQVPKVKF